MKKVIALLCLLALGITMISCSLEPKTDEEKLVGTWVYEEDNSRCLIFDENGKAEARVNGERATSREYYYVIDGRLWLGEYGYKYEIEGRKLTIYSDGEAIVLKKQG